MAIAVLTRFLTELRPLQGQLKMDQVAAPITSEYRVNDVDEFQTEAAFGALRENQRVRYRVLRVVVRIGDYKQDALQPRHGRDQYPPARQHPIALRHQIWLATDDAYKAAGQPSPKNEPP